MDDIVPFGLDPDVPVEDPEKYQEVGFHPTWSRPLPSVQCKGVVRNGPRAGEQCDRRASLGGYLCVVHGGQLPNNKKQAEAVLASARLMLVAGAEEAVEWLIDLGRNANSEAVRLGAANSVLDRTGIKTATDVNVQVTQGESPAEVLADRLAKLRERIIEGEVVHHDDPDDALVLEQGDTVMPTETPES